MDKIISDIEVKSTQNVFGGEVKYCTHISMVNHCEMSFSVFIPPQYDSTLSGIPYLLFLSGLTCTEDNFTTKAGAFKKASELGLAILIPDTSPRGENVADVEAFDLGQGAGFYLDATQPPWAENFQMESYLLRELMPSAEKIFGLANKEKSICGHSMGGHGALTLYYKYPDEFISCSAFAPIVALSQVPWGEKVLSAYVGGSKQEWKLHDACELVQKASNALLKQEILIDQGLTDRFLEEQLKPELFDSICKKIGQKLILRKHDGYDHSYFFIQTFIEDHLEFHIRKILGRYESQAV